MTTGWRTTMTAALYGPTGFFSSGTTGPADHFRTSAHASPLFADAIWRLLTRIDAALAHPARLDVVDVGAGRGELLTALRDRAVSMTPTADPTPTASAGPAPAPAPAPTTGPGAGAGAAPSTGSPEDLAARLRLTGVEVGERPAGLAADIGWVGSVPDGVVGLLVATEWLDNVPLDVVEVDPAGIGRRVLVDSAGAETLGPVVDAADLFWMARWWPIEEAPVGTRVEIGWPRDLAWGDAVGKLERGYALAVDYGHLRASRPPFGSLTGYRDGRQVPPVPDGRSDVTAHVAMDAVAAAVGSPYTLCRQRAALHALGVDGGRPPLALASSDPAGYVRALAAAGAAAELTDPAGLGDHWWLLHGIGVEPLLSDHRDG